VWSITGWAGSIKRLLGEQAVWAIVPMLLLAYPAIVRRVAREPDLSVDDPETAMPSLPPLRETVMAGLHYLLPVMVLIWSLMVEELSPGLSAFYAALSLVVILPT
jgi:TRAP-type uncharacterized transport system fused permease subunit